MKCFRTLIPALLVAGCATHPVVDDYTRKSTYDVVKQIRCEARRAILDHGEHLQNAAIAYEFTFNILEGNDASIGLSAQYPFAAGLFALDAGATSTRTRNSNRNFKLVDSFEELRRDRCAPQELAKDFVYPVVGEIGVYELTRTFIRLHKVDDPHGSDVFSFADTLRFVTVLGGTIAPKLTLAPVTDRFRITEAKALLGAGRTDTHEVSIALKAGPQKVIRVDRGRRVVAMAHTPLRMGMGVAGAPSSGGVAPSTSTIVSTTLIQNASEVKAQALLELDRQRILALQARSTNLLIGP